MDYAWFFWMAFAMGLLWALTSGWRERLDTWRWAAMLLATVVLGLLGSKLAGPGTGVWIRALRTGSLPLIWSKSWFGGLALASLGLWFLRKRLALPARALDLLVAPAFLALAVGRVGCLAGGCCLGTPTSLPWALHRVGGVGVHPVPVYELIFALALVAFSLRLTRPPGERFPLALAIYFAFRFLEGFVRPGEPVALGLRTQQVAALVLAGFWLWQVRAARGRGAERTGRPWSAAPVLLGLAFLASFFGTFLATPLERLVLWTSFVLVVGASFTWELVGRQLPAHLWRKVTPVVAVLVLVLGAGARFPAAKDSLQKVEKFWRVGGGGAVGRYQETCGGWHDVSLGALKVERVYREPNGIESWAGVQVYGGMDEEQSEQLPLFVINPYVGMDHRWIGLSGGVHFGKVVVDGERRRGVGALGLRLGPRDVLFAHVGVGDAFPGGAPIPGVRLGLGFGLGPYGQFRFGLSWTGWYLEPRFYLPSGVRIVARAGGGEGQHEFGFGFALPFGRKSP